MRSALARWDAGMARIVMKKNIENVGKKGKTCICG